MTSEGAHLSLSFVSVGTPRDPQVCGTGGGKQELDGLTRSKWKNELEFKH